MILGRITGGRRTLLMGLAERADLIVDFTNVPVGNYVLGNVGPDEPFGGGEPPDDKDTVIAYPGEVTRVRAKFDNPGLFVWRCHIVEHEDNEMMRLYFIGRNPPTR
jgi:FtsP/CotA-like multicopper oxidase with cupredoxin domain